ncbi:MAG: glycosyltransferase family 4 protein, partial [Candidatus Thorarchaeota archaeon]
MKIGIISDFFPMYGAKAVAKIVRGLGEKGHSAIVLSSNRMQNGETMKSKVESFGNHCTVVRFPSIGGTLEGSPIVIPGALPLLANSLFRKFKVDIVHIHFLASYSFQVYTMVALMRKQLPLVATPHGVIRGYRNIATKLLASAIRKISEASLNTVDMFAVVSKMTTQFLKSLNVPVEKIVYTPNGVDSGIFKPRAKKEGEARLGINSSDRTRVLFLAHMRQSKGIDLFLKSVKKKLSERDDIEFLVIGSGPLDKWVKERCEALGQHVLYKSYISESLLPYAFNSADIYVLPSFVEGLPQSLIEAMTSG